MTMTTQRSFKHLVRSRMQKTGESYTAARAMLLRAEPDPDAAEQPVFVISDDAIRRRTGRGWEDLLALLDDWGATERSHGEIATWLREEHGVDSWGAQAVAVSYERARGMRAVGERRDGFAISASRTVGVPVERLYDAVADERLRARWLPDGRLRERTAQPHRSIRFDWDDGATRVNAYFQAKGGRSTATISHERLPDADEAQRMKTYWRERLGALKEQLER